PQATNRLRPSATAGVPGSVAPMTSKSPADRWARYQIEGSLVPRCGSLARSGRPLEVSVPSITQLFDPSASDVALPNRRSRTVGSPAVRLDARAADHATVGWVWSVWRGR